MSEGHFDALLCKSIIKRKQKNLFTFFPFLSFSGSKNYSSGAFNIRLEFRGFLCRRLCSFYYNLIEKMECKVCKMYSGKDSV